MSEQPNSEEMSEFINRMNAIAVNKQKEQIERLNEELEQRCRELNLSLGQQAVQLRQIGELKAEVERFKFTLEEERQITRQDWAGLRCEHDRVKRALEQAEAEVERLKGIILAQSSDFVRSKTADNGIKPEGHNDLAGRAVERCLELQAEVDTIRKDRDALFASHKTALADIQRLHWELQTAKEGKQS